MEFYKLCQDLYSLGNYNFSSISVRLTSHADNLSSLKLFTVSDSIVSQLYFLKSWTYSFFLWSFWRRFELQQSGWSRETSRVLTCCCTLNWGQRHWPMSINTDHSFHRVLTNSLSYIIIPLLSSPCGFRCNTILLVYIIILPALIVQFPLERQIVNIESYPSIDRLASWGLVDICVRFLKLHCLAAFCVNASSPPACLTATSVDIQCSLSNCYVLLCFLKA